MKIIKHFVIFCILYKEKSNIKFFSYLSLDDYIKFLNLAGYR